MIMNKHRAYRFTFLDPSLSTSADAQRSVLIIAANFGRAVDLFTLQFTGIQPLFVSSSEDPVIVDSSTVTSAVPAL